MYTNSHELAKCKVREFNFIYVSSKWTYDRIRLGYTYMYSSSMHFYSMSINNAKDQLSVQRLL